MSDRDRFVKEFAAHYVMAQYGLNKEGVNMNKNLMEEIKKEIRYDNVGCKSCSTCNNSKRIYDVGDAGDNGYLICKAALELPVENDGLCKLYERAACIGANPDE